MYFDNKVYCKLILQTNYDRIVDLEKTNVTFSPFFSFHNNLTKAILVDAILSPTQVPVRPVRPLPYAHEYSPT